VRRERRVLIAHLSDTHLMAPDDPLAGVVDTAGRLADAVTALTALPHPPDVTVITGDLGNRGTAEEYRLLREVLDPLPGRLLVLPGNHDDRAALRAAFPDHPHLQGPGPGDGPDGSDHCSYAIEDEQLRFVALDTTVPGRDDGELDAARLDWLAASLAAEPDRPTLLLAHHPPYSADMWWMDYRGLKGGRALRDLLARHPQVLRVLCGHVHRRTEVAWGGTVLCSAPSTFYATSPPTGGVEVPEVIDVVAPIPLLRWDGAEQLLVATELDPPGPHRRIPFPDVIGPTWPEYAARARSGAEMPSHR
jgi:3',5'-cyclic AMP phosphodiesterase CpdA